MIFLKTFFRRHQLNRTSVLQQDQSDCGVACLLSIIRYYGGSGSFEDLRRLSGTTIAGTSLLGLYTAAIDCGFEAEGCIADIKALVRHKDPCILHVVLQNGRQHYLVCYGSSPRLHGNGKDNGTFTIGDPAHGIREISSSDLDKIWQTKTCLVLKPGKQFPQFRPGKTTKRKWLMELIKEDLPALTIAAMTGIGIAVLGMVLAIFFQRLIDNILPERAYTKLAAGIASVFLLLIVKESLSLLRQHILLRQSKEFNIRINHFFFDRLLHLPKSFFDSRQTGELTARLHDSSRIQQVVSLLTADTTVDLVATAASACFIFSYSWKAGTICVLAVVAFYCLIYVHRKNITNGQRDIMSARAMTENNYITTLLGIESIKTNNKHLLFAETNKAVYQHYQDKILVLARIQSRLSFFTNSFAALFLVTILSLCSQLVLMHELTTGELVAITGIAGTLLPAVAGLALVAIPVNEARLAFDRLYEFVSLLPEQSTTGNENFSFRSMQVSQLGFRFVGRSRILKNVSFEINKGEIIAITGENGSGKSTLTQILQKNYNPGEGLILLNGTERLEKIPLATWRNTMGIVPQSIHLFNGTVLQNIAFEDAIKQPGKVVAFLEETGLAMFINKLPRSAGTVVGEAGMGLSGGQKQVIALARALYRKPQLLILDEGTAAMDRQSELSILALLNKLRPEMAVIFITHKLDILKKFCDRVYILEDGCVSASGSHAQLLAFSNSYSRYWQDLAQ